MHLKQLVSISPDIESDPSKVEVVSIDSAQTMGHRKGTEMGLNILHIRGFLWPLQRIS